MGFGKENYVTLTLFPREWYDDIMYLRGSNWSMKKRRGAPVDGASPFW